MYDVQVQTELNAGLHMARLSITEAIKQSGVSRTHFYGKYINKGLISVSEHGGKKYIDSSELVRVFGELKGEDAKTVQTQTESNAALQAEIKLAVQTEQIKHLKEQLSESKQREQQYIEREQYHREQIKLLESPVHKPNPFKRWWRGL